MARKYAAPDGWTLQAFQFALDPTPKQWQTIRRQWGGRRYAYNWAVRTLKADLEAYHATGESREPPSFYGLRWRWNREKATECLDRETGEAWWPQISKEAFANGIKDAVDAYWRWQQSRAGKLDGRRVGFPRFKRKGRDPDRCTFSTGPLRIEPDRRHVTLPRIGTVRTCENTRRLERLIRLGRARILAATLKRVGERAIVVFRVEVQRPQGCPTRLASWGAPQRGHPDPDSTVGVDVGVRWLVTVATADGMIERVPAPLARNLTVLRRLSRSISRSQRGSNRCRRKERRRARLHARIAAIRRHEIHRLTTRLAKTHGRIVVEGLDAAGMLRQNGLPGARARRRGLADSALAEVRRQLRYKTGWYGSELVEADRFFPNSKTCHRCGSIQDLGWAEHWRCDGCGARHQRDENAAINLARYSTPPVGSVGAFVKRRAAVRGPHEAGLVGTPVRPGLGIPSEPAPMGTLPGHAARKREARQGTPRSRLRGEPRQGNPVRGAA